MMTRTRSVAVIGGGPAGMRAAEVAAISGAQVTLYDHKPSVGRKFLVAGKSGLNLTNDAAKDVFLSKYSGADLPVERWAQILEQFDNVALRKWAADLGVETFVASGGKVFPESKKAAPLLRRWVMKLKSLDVTFAMNHRWCGLRRQSDQIELDFNVREQSVTRTHDAVVLALGGGSWPQKGSDGGWSDVVEGMGVSIHPLQAANCGWECDWTDATREI
ncbi:MAG: TIGR03862 family flavoprotein, partial [Opitutales bacterium]|nr:TIGR03862 family flavoprotein [Opitutales bacterium]